MFDDGIPGEDSGNTEEKTGKVIEPLKCCECKSQAIEYDDIRDEHVCLDCGLVLRGPPAYVAGMVPIYYPWGHNFLNEFDLETVDRSGVIKCWYGP